MHINRLPQHLSFRESKSFMHKFNISFVLHLCIIGLTSWIWTSPSIEELKCESPSKWTHTRDSILNTGSMANGSPGLNFIIHPTYLARWEICSVHLGPLHTWDWEPMTIPLQALSLVEKQEPVQVRFTLHWGTNGVCEWRMDVKSTWIPTWHQMDHVSWLLGLFSKTTSWR